MAEPDFVAFPRFHCGEWTLDRVAEDLACDEALLDQAEHDGVAPLLRFWEAERLTVVLGASSRLDADVDVRACQADAVPIARRTSGGGTVLIGPGCLNVALVLPIATHPSLRAVDTAQTWVLRHSARCLRGLVPTLEIQGHGDITINDQKVCGSAQRRLRAHLLVHFSLLYAFPIDAVGRYLKQPVRQPVYRRGRPHHAFLANLDLPRARIVEAIEAAWMGPGTTRYPISPPWSRMAAILADKIEGAGWVERFR